MKKLLKTIITLAAIGVAVKVIKKQKNSVLIEAPEIILDGIVK